MTNSSSASQRERDRFYEKLSVVTLYIAGFYFLIVPILLPDALGWTALAERFDASTILCFAVGFQFLYIATLTRDKFQTRRLTVETLEALNRFVYGADYRRHRETVDLLIGGLGTSDSKAKRTAVTTLEKMTGQSFGEDRNAWAEWWRTHRSRFRVKPGVLPEREGADEGFPHQENNDG